MKRILKTVIDTNIFISALLGSKNCRKIRDTFANGFFDLVISAALVTELIDVAGRPKFNGLFVQKDIDELLTLLNTGAELVIPEEKITLCRDPEDNIILECALAGKADFIITGDNDLLSLKQFENIPIITPHQFLKLFTSH